MIQAVLHADGGTTPITSDTWQDILEDRGYNAFIFDCDGTLVESAEVHFTAFYKAVAEQGQNLDRAWYLARTGLDRKTLFEEFAAHSKQTFDISKAVARSIALFIEINERVKAIPEVEILVRSLANTYPLAVGTNAEKQVAQASLHSTGMLDCFDCIVAITDGLDPKPSPQIFAKAAAVLGYPLRQTLVIEDSKQGVAAAKAAKMDVIEITALH